MNFQPTLVLLGGLLSLAACTDDTAPVSGTESPTDMQTSAVSATMDQDTRITLGSAAKRLCSSVFISGREQSGVMAEELNNPVLQDVEFSIDTDTVTARIDDQFVQALFRPRIGCTLLNDRSISELRSAFNSSRIARTGITDNDREWPLGNRVNLPDTVPGINLDDVNSAVNRAFFDIEPNQNINTRAVLIIHRGRIIAERYAPGWTADMPQLGWSMAKTVTGALTGMMEADGMLDIHAPASVAEWQSADDPRGAITTHQLLQMSSGLNFSEVYTAGSQSDVILMLYTTGDTGGFAAKQTLGYPPGTHWSYSSGTTNIISRMQRSFFDDLHDYVNYPHARLFQPLGMHSAIMELDEADAFVGSSYMYATPRDWAKFGLLYMQDGTWNGERILPEGWVDYSRTPAESTPQGNYGAQLWLNAGEVDNPEARPMPDLPAEMAYLSGFEGQNILMFPEQELIVMRMGLTTRGPRPVWELAESVLAAMD